MNPYDPCVTNKAINGKQLTIVWQVDDLKISHVNSNRVTKLSYWLKSIYGDLKVNRGKKHENLGIDFDFLTMGEVKISMIPYTQEIIKEFPEELRKSMATPVADYLFQVRDKAKAKKLPEEQGMIFHHTTAVVCNGKSQKGYSDCHGIPNHCSQGARQGWLGKTEASIVKSEGDSIYATNFQSTLIKHYNMVGWCIARSPSSLQEPYRRIHITRWWHGHCIVQKEKINGKSSTESELVMVNDMLPQILLALYFLEEWSHDVKENIIYQDNKC